GLLVYKSPTYVIVDAHGVGYRVFVPLTTFYELPDAGQPVTLNIHTHVKQDGINLFGFHASEERDIFQLLLAVNGIGPKLAVNILSGIAAGDLLRAVSQGNLKRLVTIPGVGRKMAERIILELKDRVLKLGAQEMMERRLIKDSEPDILMEDALSALVNLGYKNQAAEDALTKVCREAPTELTLDILLKNALKVLAG
ncbi:MAG TPA: Holliday junction branch migration protein RuvA, partial [Syntrophales bacterium]|nr:Holliday junction branch migration protein RuvA [Syntrophales bacterium]